MEFSDRITGVCYGPTPIDPWSRRWRHLLPLAGNVFYLVELTYQGRTHTSLFLTDARGQRMDLRYFVFTQCDMAGEVEFNGDSNVDPDDWVSVRGYEECRLVHKSLRALLGEDFERIMAEDMGIEDRSPIFAALCAETWNFEGRPGLRYPGDEGGEWRGPDLSAWS